MPVQVRHIRYVIAAAEHGSFRRAATALRVQESSISRRVRELEDRLGTALFIRSPGGVQLTQAGNQFVERGRKALAEIELAKSEAAAIRRVEVGTLKIGIFSSLASGFLSELIQSFGMLDSAVRLTFIDGNPAENVAAVRQHQLDIAFVTGNTQWEGCDSQSLWAERVVAVLPVDHPCAQQTELYLSQLKSSA